MGIKNIGGGGDLPAVQDPRQGIIQINRPVGKLGGGGGGLL